MHCIRGWNWCCGKNKRSWSGRRKWWAWANPKSIAHRNGWLWGQHRYFHFSFSFSPSIFVKDQLRSCIMENLTWTPSKARSDDLFLEVLLVPLMHYTLACSRMRGGMKKKSRRTEGIWSLGLRVPFRLILLFRHSKMRAVCFSSFSLISAFVRCKKPFHWTSCLDTANSFS